jgi:hypothetical protein
MSSDKPLGPRQVNSDRRVMGFQPLQELSRGLKGLRENSILEGHGFIRAAPAPRS